MDRWLMCLLVGGATLCGAVLRAEEWSRFRGPNGSGVAQTSQLPDRLGEAEKLWQVEVGKGWSSPVLWGGRLFLTLEAGDEKRAVACLDAKTGLELWQFELPYAAHQQHKFNSFASATPFVDEQRLYLNWTNGDTVEALALDHEGRVLWRKEKLSAYVHEHGSGSSPLVVDGIMVVRCEYEGPDNAILGLNAASGEVVWRVPLKSTKNTYSTPVVRETAQGREIVLLNTDNGFLGIDAKSGKLNWQHNPGFRQRSVGSFAFAEGQLFATLGSGGGGKESALLKFGVSGPPEEGYTLTGGLPYVPTPLVMEGLMYLLSDGGILKCVDFKSGEEVYNERLLGAGGNSTKYFASPVAGDGKIYCCSQSGDVVVVRSGKKFEQLGATRLDGAMNATPALGEGRIYVRTDKSLWCFGKRPALMP